jgi:hypothetical protein
MTTNPLTKPLPLQMTERQLAAANARQHGATCPRCLFVALKHGAAINEAAATGVLPDAVASAIRAQLCREGAQLMDKILGVGHA